MVFWMAFLTVSLEQAGLHNVAAIDPGIVLELGVDVDGGGAAAHCSGLGKDAGAAQIVESEMRCVRGRDQRNAAIQAACHIEVAGQRCDRGQVVVGRRLAVVDLDQQYVLARFQLACHIEAECGECTLVLAKFCAVEPHIGHDAGTIELQPLACAAAVAVEFEPVPAHATLVGHGIAGAGSIGAVPGMRQAYTFAAIYQRSLSCAFIHAFRLVEHEFPVGLEVGHGPHFRGAHYGRCADVITAASAGAQGQCQADCHGHGCFSGKQHLLHFSSPLDPSGNILGGTEGRHE